MTSREAIVLVGGFGTRLRGVVSDVPKPLAPVAGRPFLAWILDHLADGGIDHVVLAAGYMADKIEKSIGWQWRGMTVDYSIEMRALGTGGAVRQARELLRGDAAHVVNGDTFLRYEPAGLADAVIAARAQIGMALARVEDAGRYGAVDCHGSRVSGFREKHQAGPGMVNAGCYFMTAEAMASLPQDDCFSFEASVLLPMVEAGHVCGYSRTSGFIDIGVPEDYLRAQVLFGAAA